MKVAQGRLQKTVTWTKKSKKCKNGKGHGLWLRKLKTPMKTRFVSKVIMFEEILEFKNAIILCYGQ